jgi:hypothetical protein
MLAICDITRTNPTLQLFEQVCVPRWQSTLRRMLGCRSCELLELSALMDNWALRNRRFAGRQMVPIGQIRGSESRTNDFDTEFRPRGGHIAGRWCRVAEAWQIGVVLPPVELIQVGDVYFVRDGHHRISVATTFGAREIDALVTVWEGASRLPWEQPSDAAAGKDSREVCSATQPAADCQALVIRA